MVPEGIAVRLDELMTHELLYEALSLYIYMIYMQLSYIMLHLMDCIIRVYVY
jgi:hypothetical protein